MPAQTPGRERRDRDPLPPNGGPMSRRVLRINEVIFSSQTPPPAPRSSSSCSATEEVSASRDGEGSRAGAGASEGRADPENARRSAEEGERGRGRPIADGRGGFRKKRWKRLRLWYRGHLHLFWKIILAQIACVVYILVMTFTPAPLGITDPATNDIIDPTSVANTEEGVIEVNGSLRPVVAVGDWQKFCLAISRMSAFSMYPMLVIVFITKMKAIQAFFSKTPYSMYFGMIEEGHVYHVYAGHYIAFDVWIHTVFHILRWLSQGNIELLVTSNAGITGLVTVLLTPLITFPMMYWRKCIRYEIRKGLHYLFYVFAVAMCWHVPPSAIPNGGFLPYVLGGSVVLYALDTFYVSLFMTEKIETTAFSVLSTGLRISMPVSERFRRNAGRGGFAYINLPWIDYTQWHPFSLFEDPSDPSVQQMFLMKTGDWTRAVHSALSRDTTRPVWIKGPFPSPFGHAASYDNQILVASGIGITPALGAINAFKSSRRVNLIWAVRDPEMLEFFLEKMYLEHDGWNLIFYTGKTPLSSEADKLNTNIRVIRGRPKLGSVIPNVIYGIESKEGMPEKYTERSKDSTVLQPENEVSQRGIFCPWEESASQERCVARFDDHIMSSWGIMYCGGSQPVISALKDISIDYDIDLHIDSFAW